MKYKVKVRDLNEADLQKIKSKNLLIAKAFYQTCPFSTKVYMVLKTKLPMSFISDNWEEITY